MGYRNQMLSNDLECRGKRNMKEKMKESFNFPVRMRESSKMSTAVNI